MAPQESKNWIELSIGDIADVIAGGTPQAGNPDNFQEPGTGIAWLTPADLSGYKEKYISLGARDLSQQGYDSSSAKLLPKGSIVFSSRAPIGYVAIAKNDISTNQGFKNFVFTHGVDSSFAYHYLRSIKDIAESLGTGTTFKEISGATAKTLPFVLPPLAEQKVIADKLDTLLAQVETSKARLERIPQILKTFRQSVLAAAVSGKLTEEWRSEHQDSESIDYTEKAKEERLQKGIKEGKLAKNASVSEIPYEIPKNWHWFRLGHLALKITDGAHNTPKVLDTGYPYLMAKDLTGGQLDFSESRFVSEDIHRELFNKCQPEAGDLLVVNIGAGTGNNVLIDVNFEFSFKNIAIVKRPSFIAPKYLQYYFESAKQRIFQEQAKGGAQPFLSLTMLNDVPFALPPHSEQTEIVRRVEELFAFADRIEQKANAALERVNNLTQSILAKAFHGELTLEWRAANPELISGENSAEALLKKIKAERAALRKRSEKKTATRKKA
ncbi:restriction endonuclease subunit S [Vibrio mimicus]|uniref:restriction endonuclease subunit S n=1 Tax=Vibrio mimicus TaxID=674 RepID=UPI0011D77451|nr:restriction endonuclease subunit S [Vibrio mimicus]TXZ06952.1 restriction endonuclease subunit S [Vibrio mimicus]